MTRLAARVPLWEALLVVFIVGVGIWSWRLSPEFFLTRANLLDLATPLIYVGLMALGLSLVVIAGEIDISVASTLAVSIVSFAQVWQAGVPVWVAGLVGLAVATVLGTANGLLVGVLELPSLAVTLGTLLAYRGLAFVILGGAGISGFPDGYASIGIGYVGGTDVPIALLVFAGAALALGVLLHATRFGRYLYAIGSNRQAARYSGIPVTRVRVTVFALSGLLAGAAGVVYVGYFGSAKADAAAGSALIDVVTAVVLGGVDIFGGAGTIAGVFLALLLIAELRNGMGLANIGGETQDLVIGGLLLGAILAGNIMRTVRERRSGVRRRLTTGAGQPAAGATETTEGGS